MILPPSSFGALIRINMKAFLAFLFGLAAFLLWPESLEWWGLGIISIGCGLSALGLAVDVSRTAMKLHMRRTALKAYAAQGSRPKTARMTSPETLKNSGML
ncbi:MAG: hypothetical protein HLUCCA12_13230 [Rhodobacteraceae bacterium HLUCCA12]|nr:MAG: hypothetical protein HLUCCA12_13230 [Rhodobacteraceae bacterium HLUCCA12]